MRGEGDDDPQHQILVIGAGRESSIEREGATERPICGNPAELVITSKFGFSNGLNGAPVLKPGADLLDGAQNLHR